MHHYPLGNTECSIAIQYSSLLWDEPPSWVHATSKPGQTLIDLVLLARYCLGVLCQGILKWNIDSSRKTAILFGPRITDLLFFFFFSNFSFNSVSDRLNYFQCTYVVLGIAAFGAQWHNNPDKWLQSLSLKYQLLNSPRCDLSSGLAHTHTHTLFTLILK
jgi:hypothetical protein